MIFLFVVCSYLRDDCYRESADGGQCEAELRPHHRVPDRGHQHLLHQHARPQEPLLQVGGGGGVGY